MKIRMLDFRVIKSLIAATMTVLSLGSIFAQEKDQMVRIAILEIDPAQLENYKVLLKEEIEASVRLEPGVLTLYAVSEKGNPNKITILEIYANKEAYQSHLKTPHFLKYKSVTKEMVKAIELKETIPLIPGMKIK